MLDAFVAGEDEDLLAVARIIRGSPALQERLTVGWEREAAALAAAIAEATGADDDDLVPAHRRPHAVAGRTARSSSPRCDGLLAGEDPEQLAARLRAAADRAYDQLAAGLGEYGRGG